ncbi:PLP-dependent aminotransferase family protein [Aestuariimicrobium soli]|uniref:MocR-like transcription factor YczR n=1 Tax=Aestuariimicrobium soli TaxID=2035834 RepID=UPI003EC0E114
MGPLISAHRVADLLGDFERNPAYRGVARGIELLIGEGRIAPSTRLPGERELADALGLSRTTITRAYAHLRDSGFATARQGSGHYTRIPGGRARLLDRALTPRAVLADDLIDLTCAATSAPPGLAEAYQRAAAALPPYLSAQGYYPAGLPDLQAAIADTYNERGLATRPEQIMVTPGALAATAIVAHALTRAGERVLVEAPVYPNATQALGLRGARLVAAEVDPDHWDLDVVASRLRRDTPRLAYLIPDFQNPTGLLMDERQRSDYAGLLARHRTTAVVDEAHQALALDGQPMPAPFAAFSPTALTVGSASKSVWGGLRLGWIRVPDRDSFDAMMSARVSLDLGAPVLEQLVLLEILRDPDLRAAITEAHRERLHEQRGALVSALTERLPDWEFRVPGGGLALWCRLPRPVALDLVDESERRGVLVSPGPLFSVDGGLSSYVRIPWIRPAEQLRQAVDRLDEAWQQVESGRSVGSPRQRVLIA